MQTEPERLMQPANVFEDFQRDISYRIFRVEESIALTATMNDVFHDIFIEIRVNPETMVISSALLNFLNHPTDFCPQIEKSMSELVGTVIGKGMTKRLAEIFGGSEGCGNVRTMLMGLLPLALNAKAATGMTNQDEMLEKMRKSLKGSCIGYPSNY
jgi:DUF2889 family protein